MSFVFIVFHFFISLTAGAACSNLAMSISANNASLNSDPAPSQRIRITRNGSNGCSFFVTCDNGGASSSGARRLIHSNGIDVIPVQVYSDTNHTAVLKHFPEATANTDVFEGSFPNGSGNPTRVDFFRNPQLGAIDYQKFNFYSETFTLRLYEGTLSSFTLRSSGTFTLTYTMPKKIDLSLVAIGGTYSGTSTSKTMNFGNLTTGATLGFDLLVKYNAGYSIRYSSLNNGRVKHSSLSSTIPYSFTVNSNLVNLANSSSNPVTASTGSGVSAAGGNRFPNVITMGDVSVGMAGAYSDTITITVATTE